MVVLETVCVAFAMFSALPVPHVDWNERNMRYAMAAFPLVGAVIGALWCVCGLLPLPDMLKAAGFCRLLTDKAAPFSRALFLPIRVFIPRCSFSMNFSA